MQYLPLGPQLALLVTHESTRNMLRYRADREQYIDEDEGLIMSEVFDGLAYKSKAHLFANDFDIAMAPYVEGLFPFRRSKVKMTIVHLVVLNFAPSER